MAVIAGTRLGGETLKVVSEEVEGCPSSLDPQDLSFRDDRNGGRLRILPKRDLRQRPLVGRGARILRKITASTLPPKAS